MIGPVSVSVEPCSCLAILDADPSGCPDEIPPAPVLIPSRPRSRRMHYRVSPRSRTRRSASANTAVRRRGVGNASRWVGDQRRISALTWMGILDGIGKGKKRPLRGAKPPAANASSSGKPPAGTGLSPTTARARALPSKSAGGSKLPGKRGKGGGSSAKERIASAAAPLHDRRRRLVGARESTLRDLGGLMLEMYKRNRFREELLLDKCEEVLAIEVEIAHVDQRLFQLAPPNAAGMRPIGRCECGAPIHPGQNFCGVCGRSFSTLTQSRGCARCGSGLRAGDQFCSTCGTEAPDVLQAIEAPSSSSPRAPMTDASTIATSAVAETVIIEAPPLEEQPAPSTKKASAPAASTNPTMADAAEQTPPLEDLPEVVTPTRPDAERTDEAATATATEAFDWSTPPPAPDAAMDAAVDAAVTSPTDPGTPFAGFALSATVPPPPIADPIDVSVPALDDAPRSRNSQAATTAEPAAGSTPAPDPQGAGKATSKAQAAERKALVKAAKARAKERAKAAREARKRGGDS